MRYEARAYGTRDEIIRELRNNLGGHRSERRQAESAAAIEALQAGADTITAGKIMYIVESRGSDDSPATDGSATDRVVEDVEGAE